MVMIQNFEVISILKMEIVGSFKTLANTSNIICFKNPEDQHLKLHHHKNLKSWIYLADLT